MKEYILAKQVCYGGIMYYADKVDSLKEIFVGSEFDLRENCLIIDGKVYPIVNDVIIMIEANYYPPSLSSLRNEKENNYESNSLFSKEIQHTFSEEWKTFSQVLPEHEDSFNEYFDLVDIKQLKGKRVCDLGCGIGRWSYFLTEKCKEVVLLDFSEAIFVARNNLKDKNNCIFIMEDINKLKFKDNFADFMFSLGVLHHLPNNALDSARKLKNYSPELLIYLYYALDNRPIYFKLILAMISPLRKALSKVKSSVLRDSITWFLAITVYMPLIILGTLLKPFGLSKYTPLHEAYNGKSMMSIRQDVYDRFFTSIEQRFSRKEILELKDTYKEVKVSEQIPYWHFLCKR